MYRFFWLVWEQMNSLEVMQDTEQNSSKFLWVMMLHHRDTKLDICNGYLQ
jgi:hypothetical protein